MLFLNLPAHDWFLITLIILLHGIRHWAFQIVPRRPVGVLVRVDGDYLRCPEEGEAQHPQRDGRNSFGQGNVCAPVPKRLEKKTKSRA